MGPAGHDDDEDLTPHTWGTEHIEIKGRTMSEPSSSKGLDLAARLQRPQGELDSCKQGSPPAVCQKLGSILRIKIQNTCFPHSFFCEVDTSNHPSFCWKRRYGTVMYQYRGRS